MIQFGYYPRILKFWVPNTLGYPRVIPKKTQNLELYGYPARKDPWYSDTNPTQSIPEFWFGFGYYPWVLNPSHSISIWLLKRPKKEIGKLCVINWLQSI